MRLSAVLLLLVMVSGLVGCGGDSHESVMIDYIENMESMNKALADIEDAESAKKAGPKIKQLAEQRAELDNRANAMGKPSEEEFDKILEKHEERLTKAQEEFNRVFQRLMLLGPDVMAEMDTIFAEMGNSSGPDWTK